VRGAVGAMRAARDARGPALAVLSDVRTGLPGGGDERDGGDGAAAFLFADDGADARVVAEPLGGASATAEFLDRWRLPGEPASRQWEERFGEHAYVPLGEAALAEALKQAGVTLKAVLLPTGYEPSAIHSAAWKYLQGVYFDSLFRPFALPDAATRQMQAALEKYDHFTTSQFPTIEEYEAWISTDLMIKGLQLSGKNPTSARVIKSLRNLKSYNGNGLLPSSINYSTIFGHDLPKSCGWILQAKTNGFVPVSSQPVCGTDLPGTSTASSS